jgi:hypothetical protein
MAAFLETFYTTSLNIMRFLLALLSLATALISSIIAVFTVAPLLDRLPVGRAYFPDTPIHGLTYGEIFATVGIVALLGFVIGVLHGLIYGKGHLKQVCTGALVPVVLSWLGFATATMGMGFFALPIVVIYGLTVAKGMRKGEQLKDRFCARVEQHQKHQSNRSV